MDEIRLKSFRCFREAQSARLAPLTLLVGENSTGKTSFLAMVRALWDVAHRRSPSFKESPYDLGSFDEMAHFQTGKVGRSEFFGAGFDRTLQVPKRRQINFDVVFAKSGTVAVPAQWRLASGQVWMEERRADDSSRRMHVGTTNGEWAQKLPADIDESFPPDFRPLLQWASGLPTELVAVDGSPPMTDEDEAQFHQLFFLPTIYMDRRPFASAPVRSKPLRTYDPSDPSSEPEGANVPMYLSTAFFENKKWRALKVALEGFGHEAGLFDEISVRPLGKRGSEPFQLQVRKFSGRTKGPKRNLVDVGYGVSQVLPVITELFRQQETPMFLLQQPEVHLHPSAQAALGSLFCRVAAGGQQLLIETHSDHVVDRIRMNVRDGSTALKPEDVSILYFERRNLDVRIHSLRLDERGNVLDAPRSYRRFFMEETRRSLGL